MRSPRPLSVERSAATDTGCDASSSEPTDEGGITPDIFGSQNVCGGLARLRSSFRLVALRAAREDNAERQNGRNPLHDAIAPFLYPGPELATIWADSIRESATAREGLGTPRENARSGAKINLVEVRV